MSRVFGNFKVCFRYFKVGRREDENREQRMENRKNGNREPRAENGKNKNADQNTKSPKIDKRHERRAK